MLSGVCIAQAAAFSVKEFSPQGEIERPTAISALFSSPVVKSADVGRSLPPGELPIKISPHIPGVGKWVNELTFVYQLQAGYPIEATRFHVKVNDGVQDLTGEKLHGESEFHFNTPPLSFRGARQINFDSQEGYVDYELSFSLPVNPFRLDGYLSVAKEGGGAVGYTFLSAQPASSTQLRVEAGDGSPITIEIASGLPATRGTLGLERDVSLKIARDLSLKVINSYALSENAGSYIYIDTSAQVDPSKLRSFIEIEPSAGFSVESWGSGFRIGGEFKPRDRVVLKLRKGLPSYRGYEMCEDWSRAFIFPDQEPSVNFSTKGRFISPLNDSLMLPLASVNIGRLGVSVKRVYDSNVPFVMRGSWPYGVYGLGEEIFTKTYELTSGPNEKKNSSIDLKTILDGRKGLFEVWAGRAEEYWPADARVVNVTDMAATGKVFSDGILVWVNSISLGKPVDGVAVDVYSSATQLLASGKTDRRGVFMHSMKSKWDAQDTPDLIVCRKGDDTSVLRLENNIWNRGADEYAGIPYSSGSYQGMCYSPRGVYRPGETVPVYAIVRDENLSPAKNFPVLLKTRTPSGKEWNSEAIELSEMGMLSGDVKLSDASPTGNWQIGIYIPGEKSPLAATSFFVEDFAPPRVEIELSSDKIEIVGNDTGTLSISAKYAFGNAASELPYEVESSFIPREYSHPDWRGYVFHDERNFDVVQPRVIASGVLSNTAEASANFPQDLLSRPPLSDAALRVGVMEDSGRWVYKTLSVPYYPSEMLLGILMPEGRIASNSRIPISFAAIDAKGRPIDTGAASATIYRKNVRSVKTEQDGSVRAELQTEYTALENYKGLPVTFSAGKAELTVEFPSAGEYFVEISDAAASSTAGLSFYAHDVRWGYDGMEATLPDSLSVVLDKETYRVGDTARVKVTGNFEGPVLLSVETDTVLRAEVSSVGGDGATFSFPVTDNMAPNAWVTAHLVRAAVPEEEWTAHRAFGASPLVVDCSALKLDFELEAPERLYPGRSHDFEVKVLDDKGKPVTAELVAMLVDDAVLGLTRFKTPDFYKYYTQRRELSVAAYDVYRELMRLLSLYPAPLTAGGGGPADAEALMRGALLSPVKTSRFKILTEALPLKTDSDGVAKFSIDVPDFEGRARLMLCAVSSGGFGSTEEFFEIAGDVAASLAMPRALAPGDEFDSAITLYNRTDSPIDAEIILSVDRFIEVVDAPEFPQRTILPVSDAPTTLPIKFKASSDSGVSNPLLIVRYPGFETRQAQQIQVRPPYPRISKSASYIIEGNDKLDAAIPLGWFPGTRRASLFVSPMPQIALADIVKFLTEYPYYCLEQNISGGLALISLPEMVSKIDPLLATADHLGAEVARRLLRVQALQMYNGGFSPWSGAQPSSWLSAYAVHFMIACKERGIPLPGAMYEQALAFLQNALAAQPIVSDAYAYDSQLAVKAYISYVLSLAGPAPLSWMAYLKDHLGEMPFYGRVLLSAAYARAGEKGLARELLGDSLPLTPRPSQGREMPNFDSDMRSAALYLLAWNELDPLSAEAAGAARGLLEALERSENVTTQEAGFALLALPTYFSYQRGDSEFMASVRLSRHDATEVVSGDKTYKKDLPPDIDSFSLVNLAPSRLYASWVADGVPLEAPEPVDMGIAVRIEYFDASGRIISGDSTVKRGERIGGKITLTPLAGRCSDIVAVLPIPGGLEFESPVLDNSRAQDNSGYSSYSTFRHEQRDDRLILFVDELPKTFEWKFEARAVTPGRFTVPPIAAEGMYSPGTRSIGTASTLVITR